MRWPWPDNEIRYCFSRCLAATHGDHDRRGQVIALLDVLAAGDDPVRELHTWARRQSHAQLRQHLRDAVDRAAALQETGGWPRRRGDILRPPRARCLPSWWDLRDH